MHDLVQPTMLRQILRDMWVDPELLAELDENQKQVLFCKMREEQVRRWKHWEETVAIQVQPTHKKPGKKKVDFMLGMDGEPWVWVMGEHEDDRTIEEMLEEEAREAARRLAAAEVRLTVDADLGSILEKETPTVKETKEVEDIYCSVDEIRAQLSPTNINNNHINININTSKRDALQEISLNKPKNVLQRVAQWEKRVMEERTSEIYNKIQKKKMEANKEAEEAEVRQEQLWREQQRKAKEAECAKREIARRAREEHRRSVLEVENETEPPQLPPRMNNTVSRPLKAEVSKPPSKDAILEWFKSNQFARGAGLEPETNNVAPWFHGLISRSEAEWLLNDQPAGSFLVRVSERIWGYAISYRDTDRCKHYLIDASNGHYQFLGNNQITHNTLYDLINYHGAKPITTVGGELLGRPCHRNEILPAIFQGLIRAR